MKQDNKACTLSFRVDKEIYDYLVKKSKLKGEKLSDFIRKHILLLALEDKTNSVLESMANYTADDVSYYSDLKESISALKDKINWAEDELIS
jgi:negative regulator of replication initiation